MAGAAHSIYVKANQDRAMTQLSSSRLGARRAAYTMGASLKLITRIAYPFRSLHIPVYVPQVGAPFPSLKMPLGTSPAPPLLILL
jgi:hypothetical protein